MEELYLKGSSVTWTMTNAAGADDGANQWYLATVIESRRRMEDNIPQIRVEVDADHLSPCSGSGRIPSGYAPPTT